MISFICLPDRSSGEIRARQIADQIEGSEVLDISHKKIPKNKNVIFVRQFDFDYCKDLHRKGFCVGRDVADIPAWDFFLDRGNTLRDYITTECSFYIVNNTWYKKQLENAGALNVHVIPHHSCNFENVRTCTGSKIKKAGYVGLPEQLSRENEIREICKSNGIDFISKNPKTRKDLIYEISQIDLGIIFIDGTNISEEKIEAIKKFKPNTKLTNFQSFGIPTICVNYESFREFGGNSYVEVTKYEDLVESIEILTKDEYLRQNLSRDGIETSKSLSIESVSKMYRRTIDDL